MRGQTLFNATLKDKPDEKNTRGRNRDLLLQRNQCLLSRYYYYGSCKGKYYEEIIQLLVNEFFISAERINRIIAAHTEEIKKMKQDKLSVYALQHCWPHMKW